MNQLRVLARPVLRSPVVIAAFAGWNDAAQAATSAVRFLVRQWSARKLAELEPEEYFDFTEARPSVRIVAGAVKRIEWPATELYYHSDLAQNRDYILVAGTEPQLRWKSFVSQLLGFFRAQDASAVVTLGALIADVLHAAPVRLLGFSNDEALNARLRKLGALPSDYEGPTGITGVLNALAGAQNMRTASLWGSVPMYISTIPNPKVKLGLLQCLDGLLDLSLYLDGLEETSTQFERQVAEAIASNTEIASYVHQLEERERKTGGRANATPTNEPHGADLPRGESLVEDIEAFLRRHRKQTGD